MADAVATELSSQIDGALGYLVRCWASVPDFRARWPSLDFEERAERTFEWHVVESEMARLHDWSDIGALGSGQRARYTDLLALIARNRPILDHLWNDVPAADAQAAHG